MNAQSINLSCSLIALFAACSVFVGYWVKRRLARKHASEREQSFDLPACSLMRSYSVYVNASKIQTCTLSTLILDAAETQLSFSQLVPMDAPHFRSLLRAFRDEAEVSVGIAPVGDEVLQLGTMKVKSLIVYTDMATAVTRLETTLIGKTLCCPKPTEDGTSEDARPASASGPSTAN